MNASRDDEKKNEILIIVGKRVHLNKRIWMEFKYVVKLDISSNLFLYITRRSNIVSVINLRKTVATTTIVRVCGSVCVSVESPIVYGFYRYIEVRDLNKKPDSNLILINPLWAEFFFPKYKKNLFNGRSTIINPCMQIKKKFTSLKNFIITNSLCNFEVTTVYNICTFVRKSLTVKFHKTVCTWR